MKSFILLSLMVGGLWILGAAELPVTAETLGPEINLETYGEWLEMGMDGDGDLHLGYKRGYNIFYLRQVNGIWQDERQVPNVDASNYSSRWAPHFGVDSAGNAHFAWANYSYRTEYTSFTNNQWTGLQTVINDTVTGTDTNRTSLTVDRNNTVWVVSQSDWGADYNRKPFGGNWMGESTIYQHIGGEPKYPSVGSSPVDNGIFAFYSFTSTYPSQSLQYNYWNGSGWGANTRPDGDGGPCCVNNSTVTVDQHGRAHVAGIYWTDPDRMYDKLIYFHQQLNGAWAEQETIVDSSWAFDCPLDECSFPQIGIANNGDVLLVMSTGFSETSKVYYKIKDAETGLWSSFKRLTTNSTYQNFATLVGDGNTFWVAWSDNRDGWTMYLRSITIESLPDPLNPPTLNSAAIFDGKVYLSWTPPNPVDILDHYTIERSINGGKWTALSDTSSLFYIDATFQLGSTHSYRVRCVDIYDRQSAPSNERSVFLQVPSLSVIGIAILLACLSLGLPLAMRKSNSRIL